MLKYLSLLLTSLIYSLIIKQILFLLTKRQSFYRTIFWLKIKMTTSPQPQNLEQLILCVQQKIKDVNGKQYQMSIDERRLDAKGWTRKQQLYLLDRAIKLYARDLNNYNYGREYGD